MIKIFMSVRNRLAVTKKCIEALRKHSRLSRQIYVYDNLTNYRVAEHFEYFGRLYEERVVTQVTFNTSDSTFNAFSKAIACNQFGHNHEQDPNKEKYDYIMFLDNDIIVFPDWDEILLQAWKDVEKYKYYGVKLISQIPGGIMSRKPISEMIAGYPAMVGNCGGSGFWAVRPDFFEEIGFLDVKPLVGCHKKHDQNYWQKLARATGGPYALGIEKKLAVHCGKFAGSVCNVLTAGAFDRMEKIKFEKFEKKIENMEFDEFFELVANDEVCEKW